MSKLKEKRDALGVKLERAKQLGDLLQTRSFSAEERTEFNALKTEIDALNTEVRELEAAEALNAQLAQTRGITLAGQNDGISDNEKKEIRQYSFLRAMRIATGLESRDGLEGEMHQESLKETRSLGIDSPKGVGIPSFVMGINKRSTKQAVAQIKTDKRDITATGQTSAAGDQGGATIETILTDFIDVLRNQLILPGLGARTLTGLQGNIALRKKTAAATATWRTENGSMTETNDLFAQILMSPKALSAFMDVSKQLLIQSSMDVEAMVREDLAISIAQALQNAAINGSGSSNVPRGILNQSGIGSVAVGTNGGAPTYAHLVKLEEEVDADNALQGSLYYLTNGKVRSKLKQTEKFSSTGMPLWEPGNTINGYPTAVTNAVPSNLTKGSTSGTCSAMIFGNFNDLVIGQWGGLDLLANPYTKAKDGLVEMIVDSYWDIAVRRAESFAAVVDFTTV